MMTLPAAPATTPAPKPAGSDTAVGSGGARGRAEFKAPTREEIGADAGPDEAASVNSGDSRQGESVSVEHTAEAPAAPATVPEVEVPDPAPAELSVPIGGPTTDPVLSGVETEVVPADSAPEGTEQMVAESSIANVSTGASPAPELLAQVLAEVRAPRPAVAVTTAGGTEVGSVDAAIEPVATSAATTTSLAGPATGPETAPQSVVVPQVADSAGVEPRAASGPIAVGSASVEGVEAPADPVEAPQPARSAAPTGSPVPAPAEASAATPNPVVATRTPDVAAPLLQAAQRIGAALEQMADAPPPRSMTLELTELEGVRVRVSLLAGAVRVSVLDGSIDQAQRTQLASDLDQALAEQGFELAGEREQRRREAATEARDVVVVDPPVERTARTDDSALRI